jgi:hypothetical protein
MAIYSHPRPLPFLQYPPSLTLPFCPPLLSSSSLSAPPFLNPPHLLLENKEQFQICLESSVIMFPSPHSLPYPHSHILVLPSWGVAANRWESWGPSLKFISQYYAWDRERRDWERKGCSIKGDCFLVLSPGISVNRSIIYNLLFAAQINIPHI